MQTKPAMASFNISPYTYEKWKSDAIGETCLEYAWIIPRFPVYNYWHIYASICFHCFSIVAQYSLSEESSPGKSHMAPIL